MEVMRPSITTLVSGTTFKSLTCFFGSILWILAGIGRIFVTGGIFHQQCIWPPVLLYYVHDYYYSRKYMKVLSGKKEVENPHLVHPENRRRYWGTPRTGHEDEEGVFFWYTMSGSKTFSATISPSTVLKKQDRYPIWQAAPDCSTS